MIGLVLAKINGAARVLVKRKRRKKEQEKKNILPIVVSGGVMGYFSKLSLNPFQWVTGVH